MELITLRGGLVLTKAITTGTNSDFGKRCSVGTGSGQRGMENRLVQKRSDNLAFRTQHGNQGQYL